jgi:SnoaL-like domain
MTATVDAGLQELLDKQAIREALLRYCRGVDRADADLINSAYHADAVDEHGVATLQGADIGPGLVDIVSKSRISMHQVANQLIMMTGPDSAGSETYFTAWQSMPSQSEERMLIAIGRYIDHFERRQGEWKIAHRLVIVDHTRLFPQDGEMQSSKPSLGRRDPTDPSYHVFARHD